MSKWLEFRVEEPCKHDQDIYDGCPLCRIAELEDWSVARCNELGRQITKRDKHIKQLEAENRAMLEWMEDNIKLIKYTAEMSMPIPNVLRKLLESKDSGVGDE